MTGKPVTSEASEVHQILVDMQATLRQLMSRESVPQRFLTISSAARFTDLSEESIRRLIASRKLTAHRPVRGRVLIDRLELESLIRGSVKTPRRGRGRKSD
ncbi:DNA-binding protein [Bremerella cremea]|uniref:Helix-turn-helix domain-containing protein n=1 Tax=Blastopirellula marina TaxID=124 RepID=A0A2S8G7D8_9BACT|nr:MULTISPECIES: helix-turn-helix domain-containing protein [Pirellulaceae]PQO40376.1 hypothetical protein C5Y83_00085 [Blastopirellula marina]RCS51958.1 DNA-binding protein [Bremerella cremea]